MNLESTPRPRPGEEQARHQTWLTDEQRALVSEGRNMKTTKEARRDAREYARAQMYYGDGAGIRRKLIIATVDSKIQRDPTYARAFHSELSHQDMGEHAEKARKERERADRSDALKRNTRAILTGRNQNAQTGVLIVILAATVAHKTGYDKVIYEKGKEYAGKAKARIKQYRQKLRSVN